MEGGGLFWRSTAVEGLCFSLLMPLIVFRCKAIFVEAYLGVMKRVDEELIGERVSCIRPVLLVFFHDWLSSEFLYLNPLLDLLQ